jgi:hypothetical protein
MIVGRLLCLAVVAFAVVCRLANADDVGGDDVATARSFESVGSRPPRAWPLAASVGSGRGTAARLEDDGEGASSVVVVGGGRGGSGSAGGGGGIGGSLGGGSIGGGGMGGSSFVLRPLPPGGEGGGEAGGEGILGASAPMLEEEAMGGEEEEEEAAAAAAEGMRLTFEMVADASFANEMHTCGAPSDESSARCDSSARPDRLWEGPQGG